MQGLTYTSVRHAGAAHHKEDHHDAHDAHGHHDAHVFERSNRINTQFKMPTQEDIDY